mgnify:CR=1 FL=1
MRRLPVFFVLDCSESMIGDNINNVEHGLQTIVGALRRDPHALETVHVSVIAFAGIAKTIVPLIELDSFYPPKLPIGGGTSLGAALRLLMSDLDTVVVKTTADRKGDWKPVVYLFTDGKPTDEVESAISQWNGRFTHRATLIAVAFGRYADLAVLKRLTETVMLFEQSQEGDFKKFINWITASILSQSRSIGEAADASTLPAIDEKVLTLVKGPSRATVDNDCVTLVGRCQRTRKPYLMKYDRATKDIGTRDFSFQANYYEIAGCYPIDEEYFAWSDPTASGLTVSTEELMGGAGCPHCGNASAFARCGCGKLLCVNGPGEAICPWCERRVHLGPGEGSFEVGRGRG